MHNCATHCIEFFVKNKILCVTVVMKTKSKNNKNVYGGIMNWLVPILILQSIIIVFLLVYIINEGNFQKTEEKETASSSDQIISATTPKVSDSIPEIAPVEKVPSNEVQSTKVISKEKIATSEANQEAPISKDTPETTKDSPKAVGMPNNNNNNARPRIVDTRVREVAAPEQPIKAEENKVVVKENVAVSKAKPETKNTKIENPNNPVVGGAPRIIPDKKVENPPAKTNNEPKAAVAQAEVAPVIFDIPEIKDDTGAFTLRTNLGRNEAVVLGGGSVKTETAVDMAIAWLAIHQESDGHWDSGKYEGTSTPEYDRAVTGAAILAFLSSGQTDTKGEWSSTVQSGLKWLIKAQKPNGSWDARNYTNGICTMAVTEAAAMGCGGEEIKKSAVLAVDYILKQQNVTGCFDYTGNTKRDDMSVTGWCITALKSGALAGIKRKEIGEAYEKLREYLELTEGTKDISPTSKGLAWYTPDKIGSGVAGGACQSIAMFVSQQIGKENIEPSPWMLAAADGQISRLPTKYENANVYRIYYTYLTLRQLGGKHWLAWNEPVSNMIIAAQRQDGDFRGSWDKNGSSIEKAGRVMQTAFLCLCLEIYYRYPTVF